MTAVILRQFMPYGAPELQEAARPNMARALALGSLLASLAFVLAWWLSLLFAGRTTIAPVAISAFDLKDVRVLQPPPILQPRPPAPVISSPARAAVPVPVPDEVAPQDVIVADQTQLSNVIGEGLKRVGDIAPPAPPDRPVNGEGAVPFVDQLPTPVNAVRPEYPDLAKQAQVEGLVIVNVLVGKDGRVLEARLHSKVNVLMLNDAALQAARKWVFTPALVASHPVSVWITIPFRFKLQ